MKKRGLFAILFGMAVLSFCLFNSCDIDIGLGSAIDTEPPKVTIENPPIASIIRDAFPISGTWTDDGTLSDINVVLKSTDNSESEQSLTYSFKGTVGKDNTWSCLIDPKKEGATIRDGEYEATVTVYDNGGHHTVITRSFTIDNTPPVVVFEKPSSSIEESDINKIQTYGQYFTIAGEAEDDSKIQKIVIKFYSKEDPDTLICEKELTDVATKVSLDVAKFGDELYTKLYGYNNVEKILEEIDPEDFGKTFKCEIIAYDRAKRYPEIGKELDGDDLGNYETKYILSSDFQKFQSDYSSVTGNTSRIQLKDLYSIRAGKLSIDSSRKAAADTLISNLFDVKAISAGSFTLNPLNNPTFSISGFDIGVENNVENDGALTIQFSKGLDGYDLEPETLKVYLIETKDSNGNAVPESERKIIYPQNSTYKNIGDGQFLTIIQKDNCKDSEGESVSLEYGAVYIVRAYGFDTNGNEVVPSFDGKEFFIRFKAKNVAPNLNITSPSPSNTYLKKGEKLLIKGTTSVPDGYPIVTITCKKGEETEGTLIYEKTVTREDIDKVEGGYIYYNFEFEVPTEPETEDDKFWFDQSNPDQYVFDITSTLESMPTSRTKTVIYDVKAPTITPISILPEAEKYTGEEDRSKAAGSYLNGIVTIKVSIIDDYTTVQSTLEEGKDRRPYFIIVDEDDKEIAFRVGTETKKTEKHYITTPANQSFEIHTEDIATGTESKTVTVKIYAEDTAGNEAYAEKQYIVDQTTDIPVIFPYNHNNLTLTYATVDDVNEALRNKVRKSIITKGSDLQLRINDDDGIAKYTFKISDKNTGDNLAAPDGYNDQELSDIPTTYDFRYTVPNISGKYKCSIEVTDTVNKTSSKEFWIVVTEAAPQLSIDSTSPDNKIITLSNGLKEDSAKVSFTNTVSIDSGYENFIVKRVENVNGTDEETILYGQTEEDKLNGHSFTDTFTPSANRSENKIKYVVIDEMNNPGEREFVYNVDSTKPVIEENTITVPSNKQTESVSFRFEATAKDAAGSGELKPSGVSKIQYTFDSAQTAGNIKTIPGVTSLSETIYFNNEDYSYAFGIEGQKTIYIRAIDDVGNIGDWVSKNFMFDTKAPSVNIVSYKRASESAVAFAENTASKSFESGEAFTLSGTVSDNNGIEAFEIWQIKDPADGDDSFGIKLTDIDVSSIDSDGKWTVTGLPRDEENITQPQSVIASGNYKYTVRAIDTSAFGTGSNAQSAKKTDETVNVKIDRTAPVVTISLATGNTSDSTAYGENSIKGSAYTFRGTAEDTGDSSSGFDTLYYAFTTTEVEPSAYTLFVKPTTSSWSIPMNLVTATKTNSGTASDDTLTEGKHFLYIKGKDKAGNYSETKHVAFMVDQNAPEVSCQVYKNNTNETAETPVDGTVYLNAQSAAQSYTLRGTAWDANGISRVTVDGVAVTVGSDGKWSKEITVQGKNNHEIVVYDNSGNTSIFAKQSGITCSVIFDTALPTATIEGFDTSATQIEKWLSGTGDYYINGTASDGNGSGLKDIKIKVSDAAWATLPLTSNWSYKYSIPSNLEENSFEATSYHTVIIKVVDNANNEKSITYYFRYDKTQPEANLSISKSGYLNAADLADIVISGYAHDGREEGRELEYAKILVNNNEDSAIDVTTAAFAYNTTAGENYGNFSKVGLTSADYPDGRYEFKLDVKDKAHNTPSASSALTASFVVDKTAPSIKKRSFILNGTELPSSLSSNKSKAKIHVEFDEVNPEAVYYYVDDRSDTTLTQENVPVADWINMNFNGSNNSWTAEKDCSFNDGNGLVYIKVEDKAGNVSYASPLSYEVDTKAPDVCTLGTVFVKNDDNTLTALSGTKLVNGTKPVVFTVTATDHNDNHDATTESDPAKVASVSVKAGGGVKAVTTDFTYTHTAAGVWTITIPANQLDNGAVSVTVTDTFGNSKNYNSLFTLELDDKYPSLGNYSLATSYDATSTGAATKTFYMNNQKNGFKLEGIAKDDRINDGDNNGEIEKVELTLTAETNSQTLTSNSSAWTFEIANNEWKNWTGDVTGTITITDKAKNVQSYTDAFTIKFDNAAPKAMHWADNSNKDIYFRIGNAANDKNAAGTQWETGDAVNAANNSKNEDVGKKYSYGSWGNDSTIEIRGNFYEAASGSGLKTIYYAIFDSNPVTTNVTINGEELTLKDAFESGLLKAKSQSSNVNAIGSFAPLETAETRKVPYTAANGSRTSQEVVSNFRTSLPGFNGVENYLLLVAEDYVGNRAVDDLENSNTAGNATWNSSKTYYHINKDATAPSISGSVTEGSYTNGSSGNIVVSGTASDNENGSGLGSVKIRITDNNNETVEIENSTEINATISGNTWEVAIPASTFNSGVYTVYAKATDKAGEGNSKEVNAGTITFDNTRPTIDTDNIKFTETKASSTTNVYKSGSTYYLNNTTTAGKTFKLSGLAQDNLAVDSVNITVKNNAGTEVESLAEEITTNGTWEFTIGNWSSLTTGATIVIDAKDKAGNTLAAPVQFAVKFDINAPEVVSANLKVPEPSDTEKNLFKFEGEDGSVTDSGISGTLSGFNKVEFAFTKTNEAPNASTYIETATVDSNGAWSSNVEFKKQALQSVFGTPAESDEGTKYLWVRAYDNAGNVSGWVSKDFVYDTATPTISLTGTTPAEGAYKKQGFTVEAVAADTFGVQKVEIYNGTTKLADAVLNETSGKWEKNFRVGSETTTDAVQLADGTYNFTVRVTDDAGKQNDVTRTVKVDTTAPTGSFAHSSYSAAGTTVGEGENAKTWYNTNTIRFAVEASDANLSTVGIAKENTTNTVFDSMNPDNGKYKGNITGLVTGANTVYVKISDIAGNSTVISETVYVDTTSPALTYGGNLDFMPQAGFSLSGTSTDSGAPETGSGIAGVIIKEEHRADDTEAWVATTASGTNGVSGGSGTAWTVQLPLGNVAEPTEGQYKYTVTLKDNAGNETTRTFETTVDTTKPVISISNPGSGTDAKMGQSAIDRTSYQFKGSVAELNSVMAIYYQIKDKEAAAPEAPAAADRLTESAWTSTSLGWKKVTAEKSWSFYRDIKEGTDAIAEGKYMIYMYALDGAGNMSALASQEFHVDMAEPEVTVSTAPQFVNAGTNADNSRKVKISGSVTETNGLLSFYIKRNDESGNGTSVTPENGSWTYEDTPEDDGTYTYTFTATDKVGKTNTSLTKKVIVDTAKPTVSSVEDNFTVPTASQSENSMFKFKGAAGSVSDIGSGLDKVELAFTSAPETGTPTAPSSAQAIVTPGTDGSWASTVEFANNAFGDVFSSEGTKYLWVRTADKAGNASAWTNAKSFTYDKATPSISLTASAGSYRNAGFTLEAQATDSNGVQSVTVSYGSQTDVPLTQNASGKWEKSFRVGSETGTAALLGDGAYTFTVKVTDLAGKISEETRTFSVDTTLPEGAFGASIPAGTVVEGNTWYKSSSIRFSVNVTESNIDTVEISKDGTTFEPMIGSSGSYSATLTELTEGEKTITVRMKDYAGNENTVTKTVNIDTTNPSLDVNTASILKYMSSTGFTVSGSTGDSGSGVASLTVTEEHSTDKVSYTATEASGTSGVTVALNGSSWSRRLPLSDGEPENGYYRYKFVLKDNAGNSAEYVTNTTVDKALPELTITNPAANAKTGTNAINSTPYQFSGSISEANEIKAIYYKILALSDTTASTSTTAPASDLLDETVWTDAGWTAVTAEENWSFYRDIKTGTNAIPEGKYKIYMYVLDGAGNLSDGNSTAVGNQPYAREFHVDMAAPVVSVSAPEYVNAAANEGSARTVALSGTVTETQLDTFYIKRNGETGDGTLVTVNEDGSWTYTNTPSADGTYTYIFTATDKVGKKNTTLTKTVIVDTAEPTVSTTASLFTVPTASQTEGNLFKFVGAAGSVSDSVNGSGFDKVELAFTVSTTAPSAAQATVTPGTDGSWSSTVEFANSAFGTIFSNEGTNVEGTKNLWVRVYDKAGNSSAWTQAKSFTYDKAVPTISLTASAENKNPAAGSYRNTGFTLEATADDTYGVKKVEVLYGDQTVQMSKNTTSGKYEKAFKVGSETTADAVQLADGDYTFTVKVTDLAGKENLVTRSLSIDTTAPTVVNKTLVNANNPDYSEGTDTVGWFKTNQVPVSVTVSDGSGSGVTSVQVSTETEVTTDGVTVLKNPTSLILSGSSWTGSIVCKEQGLNTIYIKATDATGNSNVISTNDSIPVNIDTTAPLAPVFLGAGTTPASEITSLLVNKESNVTVYAALKDDGESDKQTGIASSAAFIQKDKAGTSSSVTSETLATILAFTPEWTSNHDYSEGNVVKYGEGANTKLYSCSSEHTSGTSFDTTKWTDLSGYDFWSYLINKNDMTNGGINFTVKDKAGNTADYTLFQMVVDTDKPTVSFNDISNLNIERDSLDETVYVNGTITLSGSASDNQKLSSLTVKYKKHDDADEDSKWTTIAPPANASLSSWSRTLNTTSLDDETEYDIRVIATDAAGWTSTPVTNTVKVSQDTDRPIITLTNPSDITALSTGAVNWESRTISGTVSDDDNGTISIGWYVGDEIVYDTATDETSHYTDLPINNGIWKFNLDDDGSQKVFFKVTTDGKDYYSNVSETWSDAAIYDDTNKRGTFKLTDGTHNFGYREGSKPNYTTKVNTLALVVDTIAPDVETPEYTIDDGSHWQTGVGAQTFGGTKNNKIKIRQSAWDKNDINTMTVKVIKTVNGEDETTPVFEREYAKATSEQLEANANGKRYRRFTTAEINTTGWASTAAATETTSSVSYRVEIVMNDGIKETTSKLDLTVDNTAPNISFSGPASGTHSGEITVYGTTDEVGGTTISYTVSTYGDQAHKPSSNAGKTLTSWTGYTVSSDGTTITPKINGTITPPEGQTSVSVPDYTVVKNSNVSWYVYFDNDTTDTVRSHTTQLKNYTVSLGLTTRDALNTNHTFTDLVNFYIWIKAEDAVGNYAEYPQLVCIDPQGDRPTVSLLSPEHPGDSLGGTVKLYGSAEDSNGTVDSVWVQLLSGKNGTGYGAVTKNTSMEITDFKPKDKDVEFWLAHFNGTNDNGVYYIEPGTDNNPIKLKLSTQDTEGATEFNSSTHTPENCYIKANFSGTSWNLKINKDGEFDPAATDEIANDMAVRVYARDNEKNMSYAVTRYFVMDKDNPLITNVKLKQYAADDDEFEHPLASQDARVGMYVKGKWYLEFTTTDNSALDRIFLVDKDGGETDLYTGISAEGNVASKDVRYALPTDTAGVGVFKRTIKASDVSSNGVVHTGSYDIEVYYDNEAPKLLIDTASDFNINPQVKQKDGFYELKSKVSDSSLTGTPSGVKAVGFYFLRRDSEGKGKIYDPMQEREDSISTDDLDYADGLYWLSGAITCNESGSITLGDGLSDNIDYVHAGSYIRLDGVMYKITSVSGTTITIEESHGSYTTAQIALAQFVDNRKSEYEAAKTKNSTGYYTSIKNDDGDSMIEELGGTSVVSSWQGSIVSRNIEDGPIEIHYTAFDESLNYAVGVVGNKDLATYKTYTTPEVDELWNKDADGVRTTLKTPSLDDQYASYVYTYRVEDEKAIPAYICNNAPRLAGVTIAVDYTGSENPDINNAKKTTYYYNEGYMLLGNDGKSTKKPVEVTDNLVVAANVVDGNGNAIEGKKRGYTTIKGKTWIIPEMVGGNGKLWYEYKIYSSDSNGIKQTATTALKKSSDGVSFLREGFDDYDTYTAYDTANQKYINAHSAAVLNAQNKMTEAGTIVHSVSDLESLNDTTLTSPYWFDYTIYDSTETLNITEATVTAAKLANNQKATISIAMAVEVKDETPPNTMIDDLYWKSSTDNSVYTNPATDKLEGHVELKGHLGTGFTDDNYGTDDDKVSGKVVFRGYAYDNKLLKSLNWGIKGTKTDGTVDEAWPQTYITPVSFNAETQKWGVPTTRDGTTTWTNTGDSGSSSVGVPYYYFKVYDDEKHGAYLNENGHKVYWELIVDTSYVQEPGKPETENAWAVGKDLNVYVEATDSKGQTTEMAPADNKIKTTGEDSELLRPNYKVDVVPYITGIKSRLDDNRSSNGRYQIADTETGVELIGYNLKQGSANLAISVPSTTGEYSIDTITITTEAGETITYPTINNMNDNDAVGGITDTVEAAKVRNKYNYQPSTYNESLTDDVYIQLWQFNNRAAQTNTGVGFIREPAMAFNPVNGQIGVAFSNGANKFSMAQGRDNNPYSYRLWEKNYAKYVCNALAFDESGYSHGVSVGIDTEPSSGKAGRMNYFYSRWGRSDSESQSGNFNNTNKLHIDTIGIPNANDYTSATPTDGNNQWGSTVIVEERFNSVSMQAVNHTVNGTTSPTVYIAYYDDVLERIVFRYGTVGTTVQAYDDLTTTNEDSHSFPITKYSLIAGGKNVAGTAALTPYNAGEYVALDVVRGNSIANDVVCVVWYDAIRDCLMYNYKTNPCNDYNADTTHTTTSGYWAEAKVLKEKCGQYCKIAVDANGGIHIAAYDSGNKGVGYVYLPSYSASYSEANNYYLIDAMNGPFDELGIAVAVDGTGATGKAYPTISYYANGTPKMATYSSGITKPTATNPAMPAASWTNGKYTGNWDVCYVPSASQLLKDHVNVVQPQNTSGVINRVSDGTSFATAGGKDNGTVTGNTTTNPILGYAIREGSKGYLEIAQRK